MIKVTRLAKYMQSWRRKVRTKQMRDELTELDMSEGLGGGWSESEQ